MIPTSIRLLTQLLFYRSDKQYNLAVSTAGPSVFTLSRAGFWIRTGAALLDFVLIYLASIVAWFVAGQAHGELSLGIIWLVYSSFEIWTARTFGKFVFGLIIRLADDAPADRTTLFL